MKKIFSPGWEWREQYPASNFENISMDEFDRRMYTFIIKMNLFQLLYFNFMIYR